MVILPSICGKITIDVSLFWRIVLTIQASNYLLLVTHKTHYHINEKEIIS